MAFRDIEDKSQDEIDAVINQLAVNYKPLAVCSQVSKRWHGRCRQQGFRRAKLAELDGLQYSDWFPSLDGPDFVDTRPGELWISSTTLNHPDRLNGITSLTLDQMSFTPLDSPELRHSFCNLIPTLRSLRLLHPTACSHALFRFISMFDDLQETTIHSPVWKKPPNAPVGNFGQRRGELCISEFDDESSPFLSLLDSQVPTGYERLTIKKCNFDDDGPLQRFVSANSQSMRRIQIVVASHGEVPLISLGDCPTIEQICINGIKHNTSFRRIASIVSSVTSPRFQKLILKFHTTSRRENDATLVALTDGVGHLDEPLSRLVRVASGGNRGVSLVLLGQEPEFLAQGLINFHASGCIWAGEEIVQGQYSWTLTTPKKSWKRYWVFVLKKMLGRGGI